MPTLKLQTNAVIPPDQRPALLRNLSNAVAEILAKPESYVMVILEPNPDMCFGGTAEPLAYVELKSLGLPELRTAELSSHLCGLLETTLQIPMNRIYIEFVSPARHMFGWNGGTF